MQNFRDHTLTAHLGQIGLCQAMLFHYECPQHFEESEERVTFVLADLVQQMVKERRRPLMILLGIPGRDEPPVRQPRDGISHAVEKCAAPA